MSGLQPFRLALIIALRELRRGGQGIGVFIACLFLGVFAISGVGSFSAAVHAGLRTDSRALLGGDIEITLAHRTLDEPPQDWLSSYGPVSRVVNMRAMPHHLSSGKRMLAEIKAVDGQYPLYGHLRLSADTHPSGALAVAPDGRYGALADAELLRRFGAGIGDVLDLGAIQVRITAILEVEPDRNVSLFTLAPRLMIRMEAIEASGLLQPGSLATYAFRLRLPEGQDAATTKSAINDAHPAAGWRIRTWQEAEPRISAFLDRMTLNLTLTGLCALLAGGVGIGAAVRGYLQSRITHIATLKSMGAAASLVFNAYLLQLLMIGTIAILAALVGGASIPYVINALAGESLPLPVQVGWYAAPLGAAAWYGLLITLLFTMIPLSTACRVSPVTLFRGYREPWSSMRRSRGATVTILLLTAILAGTAVITSPDRRLALWFSAGAAICFAIFRTAAWLVVNAARFIPRPPVAALRMALASITRRDGPAAGIVFSLGLGMTALVIVTQVQSNLNRMVTETIPQDAPSCFVMGIPDHQTAPFDRLLGTMPAVKRVVRQPALRGRITAIKGVPADQAGMDPSVRWAVRGDRFISHAVTPPHGTVITDGQWWPPDDDGRPMVSLTQDVATGFGVGPGDELTVNILGREITAVIANLRQVEWSSLQLNFAVILNSAALAGAPQTHLATLHTDSEGEDAVFDAITGAFPDVILIGTRAVLANVTITLQRIGRAFSAMAAIVLLTGFLVLAGAISADQQRRLHDAVIFKVCGATRHDLTIALGTEFALLGLVAALISVPVGSGAARAVVTGLMTMDYQGEITVVLATLVPGLLLIVLTGLAGTWHLLGRKPAAWLRCEHA